MITTINCIAVILRSCLADHSGIQGYIHKRRRLQRSAEGNVFQRHTGDAGQERQHTQLQREQHDGHRDELRRRRDS